MSDESKEFYEEKTFNNDTDDSKEDVGNEHHDQNSQERERSDDKDIVGFIRKAQMDNYEITINSKNFKNPAELLEKFYLVRENEGLTNEEKIKQVRKIVNEYME